MEEGQPNKAEVVLVGCGCPLRGMGWYHATQLLANKCKSAKLSFVVEPWFMGPGANGPGGAEFLVFKEESEKAHGVIFLKSVQDLPAVEDGTKRMALVSGRTVDNPRLLGECISAGCSTVYLEKPGAPTVADLESMKEKAADAGVAVLMGYNKNICKYVAKTREFAASVENAHVTFVANNSYANTPESLGECFERNSEGMLKNMAIHELALLVSFYEVTVENIESVIVDKDFSSVQTLQGPSGKEFTDFDKVKFTIKTKNGNEITVQADRCGGDTCYGIVTDESGGEIFRYSMPDDEDIAMVERLSKEYPGAMGYFFSQDPDYVTLKERVANFCANGIEAEGVATIEIAYNTLRVAEFLKPKLIKELTE